MHSGDEGGMDSIPTAPVAFNEQAFGDLDRRLNVRSVSHGCPGRSGSRATSGCGRDFGLIKSQRHDDYPAGHPPSPSSRRPSQAEVPRHEEQDSPEVQEQRRGFCEELAGLDPQWLIFLDECGADTAMTRTYGRKRKRCLPSHQNWASHLLFALNNRPRPEAVVSGRPPQESASVR